MVDKGSFHTPAPILTNKLKKTPTTKETQAELRKAAVQPERKTRSSNRSVKETTGNDKKSTRTNKSGSRPTTARSKPIKQSPVNENDACIFCEEVNPEFNEDTLIKHYYNTCPVLTNCSLCQIVTEISTLNEHMLVDCEKHHLVKECNRCKQAIPVEQWHQHTLKGGCKIKTSENDIRCPLCLVTISPANDAGWKAHLMTGEGCTKLKRSRAPKQQKKKRMI